MDRNYNVLHFSNVTVDVTLLRGLLKNAGVATRVQDITSQVEYTNALSNSFPQTIVYNHPNSVISLKKVLEELSKANFNIPLILIVEPNEEEFALDMLKSGVSDYVLTDRIRRLPFAIANLMDNAVQLGTIKSQSQAMKMAGSIAKIGNIKISISSGVREWSYGAELIFGFEPGSVKPSFETFLDLVSPDDQERVNREIAYGFACLDEFNLDFKLITRQGQLKYIVSRLIVTRDEHRIATIARCFIRDVTESKIAELKLKGAYDELNLLFNTIDDTYYSRDMISMRITQISPACEKLYGYTAAEFLADPKLKGRLTHPDFVHLQSEMAEQLLKGKTTKTRYPIIHKDSTERWVENKVVPTFDEQGRLVRIDGVIRDITEQKNTDLQLKNNEQRFKSLFENIADIVTVFDTNREFLYVNDNLSKVLGYSLEEYKLVRYKPGYVHPDYIDDERLLFQNVFLYPGKPFPFTLRFKHQKGHWVWVEGTVQNLLQVESVKGIVANYRDITEKKNSEIQLQRSEQRFRALVENSIDMVTVADINGNALFISDNITKLLGYTKEEYLIMRLKPDFIHPKDQERQRLLYIDIRNNPGKPYPFTCALKHQNGDWIWVDGTICNFLQIDSIRGIVANFRDITQRRKDYRDLQKSQANLSAIIENTTDLVYSLDRALNFITFNTLFKTTIKQVYGFDVMQGYSALSLLKNLDTEAAAQWRENYAKALNGIPLRFVKEYDFNGGQVYLSYSINPIWQNEKVIGLSVFSRDITKEKLDELAIQQSEANMRSVFENTDVSIHLFDIDLNIISFNTLADKQSMLFVGKKLEIGASAFNYFPKERLPAIYELLERVKEGKTVSYETNYTDMDGNKEWLEAKWFSVLDKNGKNARIILTYRNISEKKIAEIEREKITTDLVRRNEDLEQFTYIISHNLRAPVANIKGLSELSLMEGPEGDEVLAAINSSIGQLDNVIIDLNHILQVGKQVNDRKERIFLEEIFGEISLELKSMILQNKATIQYDFGNVSYVFTIKGYLYSIFQNLVVNSIKYRRPSAAPVIQISAHKKHEKIIFRYTDNGKGIDLARYGDQLFGLYKRFDFSVEGKGVGLFMVKMQVQSLGGSISAKSVPGKGITFTITVPTS